VLPIKMNETFAIADSSIIPRIKILHMRFKVLWAMIL
jgi:hypothetical protein